MTEKQWFIHLNDQNMGPYSLDELRRMLQNKQFNSTSIVWKKGMKDWVPAQSVQELNSLFSKAVPKSLPKSTPNAASRASTSPRGSGDLSVLLEVKREDMDDRTSAIDRSDLKQAHKEAAKVMRHIRGSRSKKSIWILIPFLLVLGGGFGIRSGWVSTGFFSHLFNPVPQLEDMKNEDYLALSNAAQSSLDKEGPKISIALSQSNLGHPVFYIATNLPKGIALNFYLMGKPGRVLSEKTIDIRVPVLMEKKFAKTRSMHAGNGSALPLGHYGVFISEDDEQTPSIKTFLASLPESKPGPSFVPPHRKVLFYQPITIKGPNDSNLNDKLQEIQKLIKTRGETELLAIKKGVDLLDRVVQSDFNLIQEYFVNAAKPTAKKKWDEYHKKWQLEAPFLNEGGYYYANLFQMVRTLKQDIKGLHDFFNEQVQSSIDRNILQQQYQEKLKAITPKLEQLKQKANAVARATEDPQYIPDLGAF